MNPLLQALLGLTVGAQPASPVDEEKQRIIANTPRPEPNSVQPVQPEVASLVPPDRAQPVNTTERVVASNAMDPAQISDAYKTPPDLSQMYLDMMNSTIRRQQLDSGLTLIAAGLAQDQNKSKLIEMAGGGGTSGGQGGDMFKTIFDLQTKASEAAQKNALRQRLPAIAKAHGLSLEDAQIMFEGGQLEEFLKEAANPETEVIERADGSKALINSKTGETVREVGGAKPRGTEYRKVGDRNILVYSDTSEPVDPAEKLPSSFDEKRKKVYKSIGGKEVLVYDDTGEPVSGGALPSEVAIPPKIRYEEEPSTGRKLAVNENTGERMPDRDLAGKADIEFKELADGTIQPIDKRAGRLIGTPFGPRKDISTDDMKEYAVARAAAEARGEKFLDFDVWLDRKEKIRGPKSLGTEKLTDKLGANRADQLSTSYEQGKGSRETIDYVNTAREQLEKGIIAGSEFSPLELRGRKLWADILGFGDDDQAISNTETFRASLKEVVLSKIKALGSGTAISDADRRYIDQATGGDITLNEASMHRIFDILDKGARKRIDQYNSEVDELLATFTDPEERAEVERNLPKIRQPEAHKSKVKTREEGGTRRTQEELMRQYLKPKSGG